MFSPHIKTIFYKKVIKLKLTIKFAWFCPQFYVNKSDKNHDNITIQNRKHGKCAVKVWERLWEVILISFLSFRSLRFHININLKHKIDGRIVGILHIFSTPQGKNYCRQNEFTLVREYFKDVMFSASGKSGIWR